MGKAKGKIKRLTSIFTALVIMLTTIFTALPGASLNVYAASRIQDVAIGSLDNSVTSGYSPLALKSNITGIEITTSKNLTKAKNGDKNYWIWQERDQGATNAIKNLGDAYISKLKSDETYWIRYNNFKVEESGKQYDVKVVFDNAKGEISGAEGKDIAIFDGQLGAVRFRGFKHLDCSIYVYEHDTNILAGTDAGKFHLRFIDIDCHQAVEVLSPGRVDWAFKKKAISWAGKSLCNKIGAEQGNTVWFNGAKDVQDNWIQKEEESVEYKTAARHTLTLGFTPSSAHKQTFKVRYYAGGSSDIGTQTNGVFFSFDGGLDLESLAKLSIDKASNAYNYKVGDTVTYTLSVRNVTSTAVTAENVVVTDTIPDGLHIDSVTPSSGTASVNGQTVTVNAGNLALNGVVTVTIKCTALELGNNKELYNTARATCDNIEEDPDHVDDDAEVYVNTAKVSVDKVTNKYEYEVGDTVNYTVKVRNSGGTANNVSISDSLPAGFDLDYDSVQIAGLPQSVTVPVAGTSDPTNKLNPEYRNETEVRNITADKAKNGENGWKYTINHLPSGAVVTITYNAKATSASNGKESQNVVTVSGDNFTTVKDDAEVYVNTAKLSIDKKYVNPYKAEKKDNRCDNEFRVYEEETGFEKVQYEVIVKSVGEDGTVAKNVVIDDTTLPEGLELNYNDIEIIEKSADGSSKEFSKASGGNGKVIKYKVAGTPDTTNQVDADKYNEKEDRTPVITIEKSGNGFIVKDTLLEKGASLVIKYTANALENETVDVNGSEITNTAKATADNVTKKDGNREVVTDNTTVYINSPRLKIVKSADSGDYEIGDNVSYTIDVINTHVGTIARNLVFTDKLETKGVQFLTGTIALYDTDGYELREGTDLAGKDDYTKKAKVDEFTLTSNKHLVVDGNYSLWDLANGKTPETQDTWNPKYVGVTSETKMSIKYDMKITDKDLAGKDILNTATAVSDEALKVTTDETVTPDGPNLVPSKEVDNASPQVGSDVTFTLRFSNKNQNTVAKNVQITDRMNKSNTVKIKKDSMKVTLNNKDVTDKVKISYNDSMDGFDIDTGLDLTENDTIVVTYKAKVLEAAKEDQLINTTGVNCENNPDWKYSDVPFTPNDPEPELKIEKTSDKKVYSVGEIGHYTVKATQTADNAIARNVVIKDVLKNTNAKILPETIKITDHKDKDITKDCTITSTEKDYIIETGRNLAQNEFFTVTYDVTFENEVLENQKVPNTAITTAENFPNGAEDDNEVEIIKPELAVTKTSNKKVYSYLEKAHYTIETEQTKKDATAINVVIEDAFQINGVKILADSIKLFDSDGKDITKDVKIDAKDTTYRIETGRDLAYGEKFKVEYDVEFVDRALIDNYVPNVVMVTADNASAQSKNEVTPKLIEQEDGAKYEILKSCSPASGTVVNVGDEIEYTITVNNVGKSDLKDVLIKDPIPEHVKYVSGGTLTKVEGADTVIFKIPEIKAGKSDSVTFKVDVVDEGLCEIVNVGYVKATVVKNTAEDNTEKDPEQSTENSTEANTEQSTESSTENSTETSTEQSTENSTENSTEATTGENDGWTEPTTEIEFDTTQSTTETTEDSTIPTEESSTENGKGRAKGTTEDNKDTLEDDKGTTEETDKDTLGDLIDKITGNADVSEYTSEGFNPTNQVVHYVPYRVRVIAPVLQITKTSDKKSYNVGEIGAYKVLVEQIKEEAIAKNVQIKDTLETPGAEIVKNSIRVYDEKGLDVTSKCTIEATETTYDIKTPINLAQGEIATVKYQVLFKSADLSGKQVRNVAKATAPNLATPDEWVEDDNIVDLAKAVLAVNKTSNRKTYKPNEIGKYTIVVKNESDDATAKQVVIKDTFNNKNVKIKKDSIVVKNNDGKKITGAEIKVSGNSMIIKTKQDLAPKAKMTVTYNVKFTKKGTFKNTVVASSENTDPAKDNRTVKVTKTGVSPVNVTPRNVISGGVKTGDVLSLLFIIVLISGTGYFAVSIIRRRKKK